MNTLKGLDKVFPGADIDVAAELGSNTYGLVVARRIAQLEQRYVQKNPDEKDLRKEVIEQFTEMLKKSHPDLAYPNQTAKAGLIMCINTAVQQRREEEISGAA